jgi:hypothetical protein
VAEFRSIFGGFASDAGNQPATIASKNGRNLHLLLLLRGNSIVSACGIDRGWVGLVVRGRLAARTANATVLMFTIYIRSVNQPGQVRTGRLSAAGMTALTRNCVAGLRPPPRRSKQTLTNKTVACSRKAAKPQLGLDRPDFLPAVASPDIDLRRVRK